MNNFNFWQKWLVVVSVFILLCGILITFSGFSGVYEIFNRMIAPAFEDPLPSSEILAEYHKLIYAVLGATMAGWGVFMVFITQIPFQKQEKWAWNCMFLGSLLWYVLDTGFSWYHQVYANVALNTVLFVLLQLPLVFTRKAFVNQRPQH